MQELDIQADHTLKPRIRNSRVKHAKKLLTQTRAISRFRRDSQAFFSNFKGELVLVQHRGVAADRHAAEIKTRGPIETARPFLIGSRGHPANLKSFGESRAAGFGLREHGFTSNQ